MSGESWKSMGENYKNNKKKIIDGYEETPHKKQKKKHKDKRSKHKHEYIPAIYHNSYLGFNSNGKKTEYVTCGSHCKHCGRVKNMSFLWTNEEERMKQFRDKYPDCKEIYLPEEWDYFRNKTVPI